MSQNNIAIFFTTQSFIEWRSKIQMPIGFVPTMGNLHDGHLQLVKEALKSFEVVVVSIFVNPTQFGPKDDFDRYPRTLDLDQAALTNIQKTFQDKKIVLFAPNSPSEIYVKNHHFQVVPQKGINILEGKFRPGHFEGVCTVVTILLNIVNPSKMYLGKKDYQQLKILTAMVENFQSPIKVIGIDTVRSAEGLALSSRNSFLNSNEYQLALNFPKELKAASEKLLNLWMQNHAWNTTKVNNLLQNIISESPLSWDYLELREQSLEDIHPSSVHLVILGVVRVGSVRLLDNLEFSIPQNGNLK